MRAAGNPFFGNIIKITRVNGVIQWIYEVSVNRQRVRENKVPDFEAFPRSWGDRIPHTPLVEYKQQLYLEVKVEKRDFNYFTLTNGTEVVPEVIQPFLKPESKGRQGLERKVILRDYMLNNINSIVYNHTHYLIDDSNN